MMSLREMLHDVEHRYAVIEREPVSGELIHNESFASRHHAEEAFERAREQKRDGNSVGLCDTHTWLFLDSDAVPLDEFFSPPGYS